MKKAWLNNRILLHQCAVLLIVLMTGIIVSSCEKVVSIDLNKANPHIVIEGIVTDQPNPDSVFLSKSGNYFEPLYFPPVQNSLVIISDNLGNIDTLKETLPGKYHSSVIQGVPGRTYALKVFAEGNEYDAVSSMPRKVLIDSLYTTPLRAFDGDKGYNIYVVFRDPPEPGNYYRINLHLNRPLPPDSITGERYHLYDDKLSNGNEVTVRLRAGRSIVAGDTLTVELLSIDQAAYDYFRTVNDILTSDRAPTALAPTNPNTNLSNGSLGYFAAYTIDSKKIILP
ncbi:MAG TPA: DUF4249 domain-containing protein [Bacteroidota bacterium]